MYLSFSVICEFFFLVFSPKEQQADTTLKEISIRWNCSTQLKREYFSNYLSFSLRLMCLTRFLFKSQQHHQTQYFTQKILFIYWQPPKWTSFMRKREKKNNNIVKFFHLSQWFFWVQTEAQIKWIIWFKTKFQFVHLKRKLNQTKLNQTQLEHNKQ